MATIVGIVVLSKVTMKTIEKALDLYATANRNEEMIKELKEFMDKLKRRNTKRLENIGTMGNGVGDDSLATTVLVELCEDLKKAQIELERILPQDQNKHRHHGKRFMNRIMRMGNCGQQIKSIREQIDKSFQTKMLFLVLNICTYKLLCFILICIIHIFSHFFQSLFLSSRSII